MVLLIATIVITFVVMEFVAWAMHKYIMHGPLWHLHVDHHIPDRSTRFEKNDSFFLFFSVLSITFFLLWASLESTLCLGIAIGICLYGLCYFLVHDIFIHQRIKWFRHTDNIYFKGLRRAHKIHHKHLNKEEGECFGMLWVPLKYFRMNARN